MLEAPTHFPTPAPKRPKVPLNILIRGVEINPLRAKPVTLRSMGKGT
jgi:hypothetical protein